MLSELFGISSIDIYTPSKGGVIYSNWWQHCSPPWFFQDCSLDPGGADVKMTDMFFPRWWPKVKDVTVTVADGALGLAVFAAPRLSTGLRFPELRGGPVDVPCLRGRRGRGFTSPETRRARVCVCGGGSLIARHTIALLIRSENGTELRCGWKWRRYIEIPRRLADIHSFTHVPLLGNQLAGNCAVSVEYS